ncbi:hypothetical protein PN36_29890, partial [Candidatus Thiomargarita nelsonii]
MLYTIKDTTFMVSLLYYFGVLSLAGGTEFGEFVLKCQCLPIKRNLNKPRKRYIKRATCSL